MKIKKYEWTKKGVNFRMFTPFGYYEIVSNSLNPTYNVLFNGIIILTDINNYVIAKKEARKDFKNRVKDCIENGS